MNKYSVSSRHQPTCKTVSLSTPFSRTGWLLAAWLLVISSLLITSYSNAAGKTVSAQAAKASISDAQTLQLEKAITQAGNFASLRTAFEQAKRNAPDQTSQDFLFYQTAVALRTMPRSSEASDLVEELKAHQSQVYVNLPDAGREVLMPMYSVSAAAKSVEHYWQMDSARQHAQGLLAAGSLPSAIETGELDLTSTSSLTGVKQALKSADLSILNANALSTLNIDTLAKAELVAVQALRTADAQALAAAFEWQSPFLLKVLDQLGAFEPQEQFEVLKRAADNPSLASAAVYKMGNLEVNASELTGYLMGQLGNKHVGATAAAVLAEIGEASLEPLIALAHDGSANAANRRALLALKMIGSERATEALRSYANNPQNPTQLRKEVTLWIK